MWPKSFAQGLTKLQSGCWPELWSHLRLDLEKDPLPSSHACWQYSVPRSLPDEGSHFLASWWLETALHFWPQDILHRISHHIEACFLKATKREILFERCAV